MIVEFLIRVSADGSVGDRPCLADSTMTEEPSKSLVQSIDDPLVGASLLISGVNRSCTPVPEGPLTIS